MEIKICKNCIILRSNINYQIDMSQRAKSELAFVLKITILFAIMFAGKINRTATALTSQIEVSQTTNQISSFTSTVK